LAEIEEAELERPEWQPVPLELPLDLPFISHRPPAPATDPDPEAELPRGRVIVIDLA
jgi:hypothetical protein